MIPDYIFETSWEVCNHVGGIHTVLVSRVPLMQAMNKDRVIFFGPDLGQHSDLEFREDNRLLRKWREQVNGNNEMPNVRTGRWKTAGEPIAILIDYKHLWNKKNNLYKWAWDEFGVQSHAAYGDYDDSCLFGYATGQAMESLYRFTGDKQKSFVAHVHEWQTGFAALYLRANCPEVRSIFTTHATGIGRSIAGNGKPLYDYFTRYNGDQMAEELNMVSKHSVEKQVAHHCDCFTTVSELTARECEQLLDKKPDVVTPNGFELKAVPEGKEYDKKRQETRQILGAVYKRFLTDTCETEQTDDALMIAISGRLEWKNKGIDVFLQAMERLSQEQIERPIAAFVMIPYLNRTSWTRGKVTVIFLPYYFPLTEGVITNPCDSFIGSKEAKMITGKSYYDLLIGMDMTVFPSYYEPWGYTPMESIAYKIPTVTTDLAGYGVWAEASIKKGETFPAVTVIHRTDSNETEVVERIMLSIRRFMALDQKTAEAVSKAATRLAKKSTWERFFTYYEKAYTIAMKSEK
ncbi:MAG: glycogen/starch synthase [Paludibacteraceae bacterium]|nr:glycogen/starch synthase [Paludibacteraceae bacterium]